MASNKTLGNAKTAKKDEFYTQLPDIEHEMQAYVDYNPDVFRDKTILMPCDDPEWSNFTRYFALNFQLFGIKKLISTSYAPDAKKAKYGIEPTLFDSGVDSPAFDPVKWQTHGRIFVLDRDVNGDKRIDIDDLYWEYLEGDGDFRSKEITKLRDEADFIITNPPFSLFREFLAWIVEGGKQFSIIGNMNAITYKEVFPLLKDNKVWLGATGNGTDMVFGVPEGSTIAESDRQKAEKLGYRGNYTRLGNSCWYTSIEHGRRHEPLPLMTMAENIKFSRHKEIREHGYQRYDNYDAIEVPYTDAIPSDYVECLGVPVSFLDKYDPSQFMIIGATESEGKGFSAGLWEPKSGVAQAVINGKRLYKRLFIRVLTQERERVISIYEFRTYVADMLGVDISEITVISGVMGVPISFLDKYCPEQFEIVNANDFRVFPQVREKLHGLIKDKETSITVNNVVFARTDNNLCTGFVSKAKSLLAPGSDGWNIEGKRKYARIFIRSIL